MIVVYGLLCCFGLAAILAVAFVATEERRQERRDRAVFLIDGPYRNPPRAIARRQRRARRDLKRSLNR